MEDSLKKKTFVAKHLLEKIKKLRMNKEKEIIQTWSRTSNIIPAMFGHTIAIHNGKEHLPLYITRSIIGRKLGEFVPTRTFDEHTENEKDNESRR
uniref:ribosomal protein S19 n=1 Tax=Vallisneria natans TaxID=62345 RepID=UPI0022FD964A|nr:ribosomal protein S19 [Vallisneria natans]WAO28698.1 ribosomal protein S19 [Vallisneria natans]